MIVNEGRPGKKLPTLTNPGVAGDLLSGKQLIGQDGNIITGTIPSKASTDISVSGRTVTVPAGYYPSQAKKSIASATQATPSITVSSGGLITASATQSAGYVTSGTKSATKQLTTQAGKTVTPGRTQQTAVASGRYTTGTVYVAGDSDLVAANIKKGVNIFGVAGTYEGPSIWVSRVLAYDSITVSSGKIITMKNALNFASNKLIGFSIAVGASAGEEYAFIHASGFYWSDNQWGISYGSTGRNAHIYCAAGTDYDLVNNNPFTNNGVYSSGTDVIIDISKLPYYDDETIIDDPQSAYVIFINS